MQQGVLHSHRTAALVGSFYFLVIFLFKCCHLCLPTEEGVGPNLRAPEWSGGGHWTKTARLAKVGPEHRGLLPMPHPSTGCTAAEECRVPSPHPTLQLHAAALSSPGSWEALSSGTGLLRTETSTGCSSALPEASGRDGGLNGVSPASPAKGPFLPTHIRARALTLLVPRQQCPRGGHAHRLQHEGSSGVGGARIHPKILPAGQDLPPTAVLAQTQVLQWPFPSTALHPPG